MGKKIHTAFTGQGARKGNGVRGHGLPSPPWVVQNLLKYLGFVSQ